MFELLSTESGELMTPYYPGNFQLLVRWIVVLGTDAYAFLPAMLASVLCLVALYGICRELGQPKWTAIVVANWGGNAHGSSSPRVTCPSAQTL